MMEPILATKAVSAQSNDVEGNLYDFPRYYDLVFGCDWRAEVDFLRGIFAKYVPGKAKSLFEPACGTGRLIFRLAKLGYKCSGLDLNPHAIDFCNQRLAKHDLPKSAFVGDMTDFTLPKPVDAAFNTINSFRHLLSEKQAIAHLQCMANCLRKGGVYVLGLHLTPLTTDPIEEEVWTTRRGKLCLQTRLKSVETNLKKRIERCEMTLTVDSPRQKLVIHDELKFRTYTDTQILQLIKQVPELKLAGVYDFRYRIDLPTEIDELSQDVVMILQKQ